MKSLTVFCGSSSGNKPVYAQAAMDLAQQFIDHKINLVYGGGSIGLMGIIANKMLAAGSHVIGVIPKKIYEWEVGHEGVTRLEIVESMHERKARMSELADGFIAMPGGIGTLDEFIEILTWRQLGYHDKPIGILNTRKYFDPMIECLKYMVEEGFLKSEMLDVLIIKETPEEVIREFL